MYREFSDMSNVDSANNLMGSMCVL